MYLFIFIQSAVELRFGCNNFMLAGRA